MQGTYRSWKTFKVIEFAKFKFQALKGLNFEIKSFNSWFRNQIVIFPLEFGSENPNQLIHFN